MRLFTLLCLFSLQHSSCYAFKLGDIRQRVSTFSKRHVFRNLFKKSQNVLTSKPNVTAVFSGAAVGGIAAVGVTSSPLLASFGKLLVALGPRVHTICLLIASNLFMTFAWYGHLKKKSNAAQQAWYVAALLSWAIALFEYLLQVPANRIGFNSGAFTLAQLKILQEVLSLAVFVPFNVLFMRQKITLNYLWASLCMLGAAYFTFKK